MLRFQVREDNAAIASLDSNAGSLKEQIKKVLELIEQSEQVMNAFKEFATIRIEWPQSND